MGIIMKKLEVKDFVSIGIFSALFIVFVATMALTGLGTAAVVGMSAYSGANTEPSFYRIWLWLLCFPWVLLRQ